MPRRGTDTNEDDITEAGASKFCGASIRGTRQVTLSAMPNDLRTALTQPKMMMSLICSCRNKIIVGAELHISLEEGTYHQRLFRGPSTNDMKK
jgi:hypothetical protein